MGKIGSESTRTPFLGQIMGTAADVIRKGGGGGTRGKLISYLPASKNKNFYITSACILGTDMARKRSEAQSKCQCEEEWKVKKVTGAMIESSQSNESEGGPGTKSKGLAEESKELLSYSVGRRRRIGELAREF